MFDFFIYIIIVPHIPKSSILHIFQLGNYTGALILEKALFSIICDIHDPFSFSWLVFTRYPHTIVSLFHQYILFNFRQINVDYLDYDVFEVVPLLSSSWIPSFCVKCSTSNPAQYALSQSNSLC